MTRATPASRDFFVFFVCVFFFSTAHLKIARVHLKINKIMFGAKYDDSFRLYSQIQSICKLMAVMWHREIKARADDQIDEEKKKKLNAQDAKVWKIIICSFLHRKPGKQLMTEIVIYHLNCILSIFFFFNIVGLNSPLCRRRRRSRRRNVTDPGGLSIITLD